MPVQTFIVIELSPGHVSRYYTIYLRGRYGKIPNDRKLTFARHDSDRALAYVERLEVEGHEIDPSCRTLWDNWYGAAKGLI